jgi:hypothetical protein
MDSNDKSLYLFNGQLTNISQANGFNTWAKRSIPASNVYWDPAEFLNFRGCYDKLNQEVLFINREMALAWSEKLQSFTSFYSYGHSPFFCNLDDTGVWLRNDGGIWKHQAGEYCRFFGTYQPYWMTLVSNPEPLTDKIFTNLEFRACVDGEGKIDGGSGSGVFDSSFDYTFREGGGGGTGKYKPYLPFDYLETWNEYQHGIAYLKNKDGHSYFKHHTSDKGASLKRKFRIWRCDVPRDNYGGGHSVFDITFNENFRNGIRTPHPIDRMRNPWLYVKLLKKADGSDKRTEIHDLLMTYFN